MTRQARLYAPGTLHHVIVRGIEKRRIEDCGIPLAEAARQLGVSTSAVSKMIRRSKSNSTWSTTSHIFTL
jgi:hypothetical protein